MDDREQLRDALDLVDDHGLSPGSSCEQFAQALGASTQAAVSRRIEKIDEQGVRQSLAQPRGFPGSARAEDEAAPVRHSEEST